MQLSHIKKEKFLRCLFLVLVFSSDFVVAQDSSANDDTYRQTEFVSLQSQNDLYQYFLQDDKYFTNGMHVEYGSHHFNTRMARILLVRLPDQPLSDYSVSIGQDMYTPADIIKSTVDSNDRPYSGLLYMTYTRNSSDILDGARIVSSLFLGIQGPYSAAGNVQRFVHEHLSTSQPANGWGHQISNGLVLDYELAYQHMLPLSSRFLELNVNAVAHAGTIYNFLQGGISMKLGLFNDSYASFGGYYNKNHHYLFNNETASRIRNRRLGKPEGEGRNTAAYRINQRFQLFVFMKINTGYIFYDGTAQGSLLPFSESEYVYENGRLDPFNSNVIYGFTLSFYKFQLNYERVTQKDVFKGYGIFGWGQLKLTYLL